MTQARLFSNLEFNGSHFRHQPGIVFIDNSPDGEGESPEGGTLVNHVAQALDELAAGKPVSVPSTKAYGCSVKYGS